MIAANDRLANLMLRIHIYSSTKVQCLPTPPKVLFFPPGVKNEHNRMSAITTVVYETSRGDAWRKTMAIAARNSRVRLLFGRGMLTQPPRHFYWRS